MTCSYAVHFPLEVNVYTSSRPWVAAVGITEVRRSPLALETLLGFRYLSPHLSHIHRQEEQAGVCPQRPSSL